MKRLLTGLWLIIINVIVNAQVSIQPALPAMGMIQKNQLWSVLVINSSNVQYQCRLDVVLRDRATGQEILTATSNQFTIGRGTKQVNFNTLSPVTYNYIVPGVNNSLQGLIPAGSYIACYALSAILKETPIAEECIQFDAEPLSPPMLVFPADSSILKVAPTQFSWTPPTPSSMFDQLQYEVLITQITPGQKPDQAIIENMPFYNDPYQVMTTINYPGTSTSFEKDMWYAWQVVAKDGKSYTGKSEVWVFIVKPDIYKSIVEKSPYIKMKKNDPDNGIAPNGFLKISYINETADTVVSIKILEVGNYKRDIPPVNLPVKAGENLMVYELKNSIQVDESKTYEAILINSRQETWRIQFQVKSYPGN